MLGLIRVRKDSPAPALGIFVFLQVLDIVTTLIGLRLGAREGSVFLAHLMQVGPATGLLISKLMAIVLVMMALLIKRPRVVVLLNYWFTAVVTWNLVAISWQGLPLLAR